MAASLHCMCWQAVRNLLEFTCADAFSEMLASTHDLPFGLGCFGEAFCTNGNMFLGSTWKSDGLDDAEGSKPEPLPNESFVPLDWTLPMTPEAQKILFKRIRATFNRVTSMIPTNQKKKYRMTGEDLIRCRTMVVVFTQILGNLRSRLSSDDVSSWISEVENGMGKDEDLLQLIHQKPRVFSLSMLLSHQDQAKQDMHDEEKKKVELCELQRQEVVSAQWKYFVMALKQDHETMEVVRAAPALVRSKLHVKQVAHRSKMVGAAESACSGYQDRI